MEPDGSIYMKPERERGNYNYCDFLQGLLHYHNVVRELDGGGIGGHLRCKGDSLVSLHGPLTGSLSLVFLFFFLRFLCVFVCVCVPGIPYVVGTCICAHGHFVGTRHPSVCVCSIRTTQATTSGPREPS